MGNPILYPSSLMPIIYKTEKEAREACAAGVKKLAKLVTITMGPKGRNVVLDKTWSNPQIIHDGVSVAREIELEEPFENMGAQLVKEAASKTADLAGDGTTTATLLAWKIVEKGNTLIDAGANPMILKEGIDAAIREVSEYLTKKSQTITPEDISKVATISAANPEVGKIISEAIEKVGENGVITVEEGLGEETILEHKEGMMFDKGYGSPYFVTDQEAMACEILDPMILFTDLAIDSIQDFSDFLDHVITEQNRNIVIIADKFEGYTLPTLITNHVKGSIRANAIQAPSFGHKRIWMLEDMATMCGGTVITRQSGRTLASVKPEELGHADKIWSDASVTKIIGGKGNKEEIHNRIKALTAQMKKEESDFEKKNIKERIARLSGGVAIIKVGAPTEAELKDRKERMIDAVEATKSAIAEGIIPGGGVALLECQDSLRPLVFDETESDYTKGYKLILGILDEPIKKIFENAGKTPEILLTKIKEKQEEGYGYDVLKERFGNMMEMGIIDPTKVTRQAIEKAGSVAGMILTIGGLVTKKKEEKTPEAPNL